MVLGQGIDGGKGFALIEVVALHKELLLPAFLWRDGLITLADDHVDGQRDLGELLLVFAAEVPLEIHFAEVKCSAYEAD